MDVEDEEEAERSEKSDEVPRPLPAEILATLPPPPRRHSWGRVGGGLHGLQTNGVGGTYAVPYVCTAPQSS